MAISSSFITLPGTKDIDVSPLPYFRDKRKHESPGNDGTLLKEDFDRFGYEAAFRVLPYKKLDRYERVPHKLNAATVIIENEFLKAEFLPEYGGRLYSLYDKQNNKELLYSPPSLYPAHFPDRGAWFPGGIAFHQFSAYEKVFFAAVNSQDGYEFLRMYDYERICGVAWQIDFHLPPGSRELYAHVVIHNNHNYAVPLSWQTSICLPEEARCRIFSGTHDVLYPLPGSRQSGRTSSFGRSSLPKLPLLADEDASYPMTFKKTGAYYLQNPADAEAPWGAVTYGDGSGFVERSTQPLRIRGLFSWGNDAAGHRWRKFLNGAEEKSFIELRTRITPTPLHGMDIPAEETITYTQAFGALKLDAADATDSSYEVSQAIVRAVANAVVPPEQLTRQHQRFFELASLPCSKILSFGSGWGALENMRRISKDLPLLAEQLAFPAESFTDEQYDWLVLLNRGELIELQGDQIPLSWMTDLNYLPYLKDYLTRHPDSIKIRLLAGVMLYENGFSKDGVKLWKEALLIKPLPILLRNLAYSAATTGFTLEALTYMERIDWKAYPKIDVSFWEEYFELLIEDGHYRKMFELYQDLPRRKRETESVLILACEAAIELSEYSFLEHAFSRKYISLSPDDSRMIDIWQRYIDEKEPEEPELPDYLDFYIS